jgi:hypothetical protein
MDYIIAIEGDKTLTIYSRLGSVTPKSSNYKDILDIAAEFIESTTSEPTKEKKFGMIQTYRTLKFDGKFLWEELSSL